jgi:hypothetical protein
VSGAEQPAPEPTPEPEAEAPLVAAEAQSCVNCHTEKAILEAMAVEEEEVQSEESSGEG